jgi:NADPH-dependent curcumin reductase CurA
MLTEANFEWREEPVPELKEGEVLVHNQYLSLDPANRGWVNDVESYVPPVPVGAIMRGGGVGVVEESRNAHFERGDKVQGMFGWQDYVVAGPRELTLLPKGNDAPLTAYLGLFGHIGLTAYFGLLEVGQPKAGETLVVSAAAGAVGSLVGQIGKIKGCKVVGIAGTDEKCKWIVDELGFDAAVNYKTEPLRETLRQRCSGGIDVYFDNVGGETLDAVLSMINLRARIAVCGMISQYNATKPVPGPCNLINILPKRARIEGFIVIDYMHRAGEAIAKLAKWHAEGRLKYRLDIVEGLEKAPSALNKLFEGTNQGKLVVKL